MWDQDLESSMGSKFRSLHGARGKTKSLMWDQWYLSICQFASNNGVVVFSPEWGGVVRLLGRQCSRSKFS